MNTSKVIILFFVAPLIFGINTLKETIPDEFDARTNWPNCPSIGKISDQGSCGANWAFSTVSAINDRLCILSNGTIQPRSVSHVIACAPNAFGCRESAGLRDASTFFNTTGIVSENCQPFTAAESGVTPKCTKTCAVDYNKPFGDDKIFGELPKSLSTMENIQMEMLKNGTVQTSLTLYQDFYNYTTGIYNHTRIKKEKSLGILPVKIVGWGEDRNATSITPFWLIANSWGVSWGMDGYFKVLRGLNHCRVEQNAYPTIPLLPKSVTIT